MKYEVMRKQRGAHEKVCICLALGLADRSLVRRSTEHR